MRAILSWLLIPAVTSFAVISFTQNSFAQENPRSTLISLDTLDGPLPFRVDVTDMDGTLSAEIVNGKERISIPSVTKEEGQLVFSMPHYDSRISVDGIRGGARGSWTKRRGQEFAVVALTADDYRPIEWESSSSFLGRWSVKFESDEDPAVAVFEKGEEQNSIQGTFLTTTGDYRYLYGGVLNDELILSCFDGAHAFLFRAKLSDEGTLQGVFRSGNWWSTNWTAKLDPDASLPDAFKQTQWTNKMELGEFQFPNLDGELVSLNDPSLAGKCKIIEVFGSWCPNCHDAGVYLSELHDRYSEQGLSIVGLAFELTGDFERDAQQVRHFIERNKTQYPILIAGTSDKAVASEIFPVLDKVRSYPTMIFLDSNDKVIAIYTGFSGPATDDAYQKLRKQFERIIEDQLGK